MLAYHNDPNIKQEILEQLYTTNYTISMEDYETRFGIPEVLISLQSPIFEGLSTVGTRQLHIRFMSAIQVGADLSTIWRDFVIWLLIDPADGVIQYTISGTEVYDAIMQIATLYRDGYTEQQIRDAADFAYDAVTKAAYTAAAAAHAARTAYTAYTAAHAAYTAYTAAHAAVYTAYAAITKAARDAVYTAYAAATYVARDATDAYDAARNAFYIKMANKLIELLEKQEVNHVSLP